jgi:hypothetical protein
MARRIQNRSTTTNSARRRRAQGLVVSSLMLLPSIAEALPPDGEPIDTSDYTIDFYDGPILAASRIVGLAGSFAPLTEGVAGYAINPASVAMRVPWSRSWIDWELDGSITFPSAITHTDFDNNGDSSYASDAAVFATFGAGLQFGYWGIGLSFDLSDFELQSRAGSPLTLDVSLLRANLVAGFSVLDGQLVFGFGAGVHGIDLTLSGESADGGDDALASVAGAVVQFGSAWAPVALPIRMGLAIRVPVPSDESDAPDIDADENGNYVAAGYYLPRRISVPVEINAAVALQLFRPLNVRWDNPRSRVYQNPGAVAEGKEPTAKDSGGKFLVSAALKVTLPVEDGIGVESFLLQRVERSGQSTSYSPRLGVEGEPWPRWLVLRGGTYLEPTRFENSSARLHATAGFDLHLPLEWSLFGLLDDDTTFRIGGAADAAERYFGWTASFGVWH